MKLLRTICCYCGTFALAMFCTSQVAAGAVPAQITIGTLYASSGPFAPISMPVYKGLKFWVKSVNADGGVYVKPYGRKIPVKLVAYNDQSSTSTAATLYNRLITQDHVDILTSDSGSVLTSVGVPIAQTHKMVLFDQTGTSGKFFSKDNSYIVQLDSAVTRLWSKPLADFLTNIAVNHGIHRVAILYSTNDFCGPQANALNKALTSDASDGVEVVYFHGTPTSTSTYTILLHRIAAEHPDAVIELGYPKNDIAFLRDLQTNGLSFPMVFFSYGTYDRALFKKSLGSNALRGLFTYAAAPALHYKASVGMDTDEFVTAFRKVHGKNTLIAFNAIGYSTGVIIQQVLATTGSMDQLALRKAAFKLSGKLTTVVGHFKLDGEGAQIGMRPPIAQFQQRDGQIQIVPLYPPKVARGKAVWSAKN